MSHLSYSSVSSSVFSVWFWLLHLSSNILILKKKTQNNVFTKTAVESRVWASSSESLPDPYFQFILSPEDILIDFMFFIALWCVLILKIATESYPYPPENKLPLSLNWKHLYSATLNAELTKSQPFFYHLFWKGHEKIIIFCVLTWAEVPEESVILFKFLGGCHRRTEADSAKTWPRFLTGDSASDRGPQRQGPRTGSFQYMIT